MEDRRASLNTYARKNGLPTVAGWIGPEVRLRSGLWWTTFGLAWLGEGWNPVLELHQPLRLCRPPPELIGQRDMKLKCGRKL